MNVPNGWRATSGRTVFKLPLHRKLKQPWEEVNFSIMAPGLGQLSPFHFCMRNKIATAMHHLPGLTFLFVFIKVLNFSAAHCKNPFSF
jgi:hypothetical protein